MSTLNPSDLLLVEREGVQYKMQAGDMDLGPSGQIEAPVEVLTPLNGAGIGAGVPYNPISSSITTVGAGGSVEYETSPIVSVTSSASAPELTFADSTNFDKFQVGDVVDSASITDIDDINNKMTLDADVKDVGDTLSKSVPYDASLTCSSSTELANMVGPITMTDSNGDLVTPQTSEIVQIEGSEVSEFISPYESVGVTGPGTAFDNPPATDAAFDSAGGYYVNGVFTYTWAFAIPWDMSDVIAIRGGDTVVGFGYTLTFGYEDGTSFSENYTTAAGYAASVITTPTKPVTSITIDNVTNGLGLIGFYDEVGAAVVYPGGKILTFADSTDLEYFSPGDAVQGNSNWDQSQKWSEYGSPSSGGAINDISRGFNGQTDQVEGDTTGAYFSIPFAATVANGDVGWASNASSSEGKMRLYNGATLVDTVASSGTITFTYSTYSGPITEIRLSRDGRAFEFSQISVFGKVLVDNDIVDPSAVSVISVDADNSKMLVSGGNWGVAGISNGVNNSEVWSDMCANADDAYPPTLIFDGDESTVSYAPAGGTTEITFDPVFTSVTSLSIKVQTFGSYAGMLLVNGVDVTTQLSNNNDYNAITFTGSTLNSISYATLDGSNFVGLYAIKVDGNLLVDLAGASSVSLPTLEASATDVVGVDGNTLQIDGVSGTWKTGLYIKGASISSSAPSPSSIVFTSSNGGTTAVTGTDATLSSRVWTLEKSSSQTGPWTTVGEYTDLDANASQDGATPWSTTKPALEADTFYQVKVKYTSSNAPSIESIYSTFKTGAA